MATVIEEHFCQKNIDDLEVYVVPGTGAMSTSVNPTAASESRIREALALAGIESYAKIFPIYTFFGRDIVVSKGGSVFEGEKRTPSDHTIKKDGLSCIFRTNAHKDFTDILENGDIVIDAYGEDDPVHPSAITGPARGPGADTPNLIGIYTCK
ncbi:MAG: hypothetical protein JKP92_06675 [Alphaproteobacteria bacterium]|jgi:hypothetical protein|nr:hypothetical protein [Alphaproteobacteria bacterium]